EQHAHLATRRSELGAREVVGEDLGVREAVLGVAVGAVLAHPDPVAPAVAGDHEGRVGACGCERARLSERGCAGGGDDEKEGERSTHRRPPDPGQPPRETRRGYQTGPESRNFLYGIVTLDLTGEEKARATAGLSPRASFLVAGSAGAAPARVHDHEDD